MRRAKGVAWAQTHMFAYRIIGKRSIFDVYRVAAVARNIGVHLKINRPRNVGQVDVSAAYISFCIGLA